MLLRNNVSIPLSLELHAVGERMLASGQYGNFSEVVRAGLRLLNEREIGFQACRDRQDAIWQTPIASPMSYPRVEGSSQEMLRIADQCYQTRITLSA